MHTKSVVKPHRKIPLETSRPTRENNIKMDPQRSRVRAWSEFNWLKIWTFGCHHRRRISYPAERLRASQEQLSSMESLCMMSSNPWSIIGITTSLAGEMQRYLLCGPVVHVTPKLRYKNVEEETLRGKSAPLTEDREWHLNLHIVHSLRLQRTTFTRTGL
jgi:hypothetical protein